MMKKENSGLSLFNGFVSRPFMAAFCGFGLLVWMFVVNEWNIYFSLIISMYVVSLISNVLFNVGNVRGVKKDEKEV